MFTIFLVLLLCVKDIAALQLQMAASRARPSNVNSNPGGQHRNNHHHHHHHHHPRRDFLISCLQAGSLAVIPNKGSDANAFASNEVPLSFDKNYVYRDGWVGTSLPIMTMEQAASKGGSDFPMGRWPDRILRRSASQLDDRIIGGVGNTNTLKTVANKLRRTARVNKAVGLAAQQCGIDGSLIFLDDLKVNTLYKNSPDFSWKDKQIDSGGTFLCNPRIIARSPEVEMKVWTEECLVLPPSFTATVLRDSSIVVQYETVDGQTKMKNLTGEIARTLQHEMDHDRGILIVDHVDLDDLESLEMKEIEKAEHEYLMALAYSRYIGTPTPMEGEDSLQLAKKNFFIEPAFALEPSSRENDQPKKITVEGSVENKSDTCDDECRAQRKKIIDERRALMKQSKTNSDRRDVLELSRQRALLYDTKYKGL